MFTRTRSPVYSMSREAAGVEKGLKKICDPNDTFKHNYTRLQDGLKKL